jgi:hypothetical protein
VRTPAALLLMTKLPDPRQWPKRWMSRPRAGSALLHNSHKPKMTPEEARLDHRQMLRFLGLHALVGALIGTVAGLALIVLDIGGLGRLFSRASNPALPLILVIVPFASLFGGAAAASAILTLPYDAKYRDDEDET